VGTLLGEAMAGLGIPDFAAAKDKEGAESSPAAQGLVTIDTAGVAVTDDRGRRWRLPKHGPVLDAETGGVDVLNEAEEVFVFDAADGFNEAGAIVGAQPGQHVQFLVEDRALDEGTQRVHRTQRLHEQTAVGEHRRRRANGRDRLLAFAEHRMALADVDQRPEVLFLVKLLVQGLQARVGGLQRRWHHPRATAAPGACFIAAPARGGQPEFGQGGGELLWSEAASDEGIEGVAHLDGRVGPQAQRPRQGREHDAVELGGNGRAQRRRGRDDGFDDAGEGLDRVVGGEEASAHKHLPEHDGGGPNVGAVVDGAALGLLG
jgi:hypothetical protein